MKMDLKTFAYHDANEKQKEQLGILEYSLNATLQTIEETVPEGRYKAIAITELEKAGAMAVKGIFKNSDGSRLDPDARKEPFPPQANVASLAARISALEAQLEDGFPDGVTAPLGARLVALEKFAVTQGSQVRS
jgi:hypothetical protein